MRSYFHFMIVTAIFLLVSTQAFTQITNPLPEQRFDLVGKRLNQGPLDCGNYRVNRIKTSSSKFDGAIQVKGASNLFIIYEWTKPFYNSATKEIIMNLEARILRGPESGFLRLEAKNANGGLLAFAQVGTFNGVYGGRTGVGAVRINPVNVGNPETYKIQLSFSDGGSCGGQKLGEYVFKKVVNYRSNPVQSVAPPASIRGTWKWNASCSWGQYNGFLSLGIPDRYGNFTGSFSSVGGGGIMSAGRLAGQQISFSRRLGNQTEYWSGRVVDGGRINGTISLTGGRSCSFSLSYFKR
ncbi:MAG: hypothetical protein GXP13_03850 [Gammaproteobacteria bacterium]|nr:hypothetical protein [Gammaproteobacteria bacterium]